MSPRSPRPARRAASSSASATHAALTVGLLFAASCRETKEAEGKEVIVALSSESATVAPSASSAPPPVTSATVRAPSLPLPEEDLVATSMGAQREAMLRRMKQLMRLGDAELHELHAVIDRSTIIGQGNPDVTEYAMTRAECRARRDAAGVEEVEESACGAPFMSALYDPTAGQTAADAKVCIDRYEFPGIPCEYPVTWASAREAALMCKAVGKRLCDAHEWEGACAGALREPDVEYSWKLPRKEWKHQHNAKREIVWAYGKTRDLSKCAMDSKKSKKCTQSGFKVCGSNSYPAGAFPECKSRFGVYDLHGNVAEHMNLPLKEDQLGSAGGSGETEMKGSWFIFQKFDAHIDDCRWRAPDWHGTKLMSHDSHQNYHLGFRCCRDVAR